MAKRPAKAQFTPKNPNKYTGKLPIIFRSSWEFSVMKMFDEHPYVLEWKSETLQIPYRNPLTGRWTVYIPDFQVAYADGSGNGKVHIEIMEVKPMKESAMLDPRTGLWTPVQPVSKKTGKPLKVSQQTRLTQIVNAAKWQAAVAYCAKMTSMTGHRWFFRVVTEETLYNYGGK